MAGSGDESSAARSKRKREDNDGDDLPKSRKRESKKATKHAREEDHDKVEDESKEVKKSNKKDGKKKKDKRRPGNDDDDTTAEKEEVSSSKKERKKMSRKMSKKRTQASDTSEDDQEGEASDRDVPMADAPSDIVQEEEVDSQPMVEDEKEKRKEKKKEKKKKKKKKKKESTDEEEEEEETGEVDKRHKSVLDRKTKSLRLAGEAAPAKADEAEDAEPEEPTEVHDLGPLPQPELVSEETPKPTYETLPAWLAAPIRVSQDTRTPFSELGLLPRAARALEEKGFPDAFAVQTAAIPLLLPTSKRPAGDLLISAATGSGKTLAYALPIVRDLSHGLVTRLRALVVLPTRELVKQAQDVFDMCARAYEGGDRKRVRVGISIGSQTLRSEQETLVDRQARYDPEAYEDVLRRRRARGGLLDDSVPGGLGGLGADGSDPRLGEWPGQVVDFSSRVDVLICTPGRLVEHMEQTPGFDLDYVRWLVVDEADKLLAQSFQGWLEMAMDRFRAGAEGRTVRGATARQFSDMDLEGVRKVILSATLTRDLSLLNQLALRRPRLIVLEASTGSEQDHQQQQQQQQAVAEHSLPALLTEHAVRVHNTNLKPLYLLRLLKDGHMESPDDKAEPPTAAAAAAAAAATSRDTTKPTTDDDSDTSSDSGSDSDSSSGSDTSSDSGSDSSSEASETPEAAVPSKLPICLVFTKSNESALRLSRLLTLLDPSLSPSMATLTSTTPTHIRRKTLQAFTKPTSSVRLIVASDLVARGIDLPNLPHVVNYDLPASVAGYVHRVGRTARANRAGQAWTLVGDDESGWFWGKIAKGAGIRRPQKVGRVRIDEMADEDIDVYEAALEKLGKEALETTRGGRR
ncbi:ATP-dependent RNA helicase DDX51/DBP6 [Geosmithia morbida]|uniref:ATP-dependent RNA helicase n=1 Tax=Geosmithia morbida TaxID=1094350 RepID=A0A9P4YV32_9HYPO|nr:ATP-dependent RNA helicase DDX51/DBP6 [Geosmithia morbida]KAF4123651.1 ATP-dependent RNA helicase DDX51/DBP6 [Geosmithia morbida]